MNPTDRVQLVTFYSYKGGVGRTMALANAACQLAIKHGKRVICVDWDLEAPGLHHYFDYTDKELANRPGLLDYLEDFVAQVRRGAEGRVPQLADYLTDLKPDQQSQIEHGSVRFMHCGRLRDFAPRLEQFDWDEFYSEHSGFQIIETLKQQLRDTADFSLIDARAGQADVGRIPTIQVPDAVVILFTSNYQNLHGMAEMARRIRRHPQRVKQDLPEPRILVVPSRVFPREASFEKWMSRHATPVYKRLLKDGVVSRGDQPKGLWQCLLPVEPRYSIEETLVVLLRERYETDLKRSYAALAQALDNLFHGREIWATATQATAAAPAADHAKELQAAANRGDRARVAWVQFVQGAEAYRAGRLQEAEALLASALAYFQEAGDVRQQSLALSYLGNVRSGQRRWEEAWGLYERALPMLEQAGDAREQGVTLHEMGNVRSRQRRWKEAWGLYERALALEEQAGDARGQGVTLHEMGNVRSRQRRWEEAWGLYEQALALEEQAGDARGQGVTLSAKGTVRSEQGRWEEAWGLYERALPMLEQAGDAREQGVTLHAMGDVRAEQGRWDEAWGLYERALPMLEQAGDAREQGVTLHAMGDVRAEQGRWDEAWGLYERALALKEQAGDARGQWVTLGAMGTVRSEQGHWDEAWDLYEQSLALARQAEDKFDEARTCGWMGLLRLKTSGADAARPLLRRCLTLLEQIGRSRPERRTRKLLERIAASGVDLDASPDAESEPDTRRRKRTETT